MEASALQRRPDTWCTEIPGTTAAACVARETLSERLGDAVPESAMHDLHLLTTELVTNAVVHTAAALVELRVTRMPDRLRISVTDPGAPTLPAVRELDPAIPGGLGLFLVEQISDCWGAERGADGSNRVWFELPA